jgi:hypothetical protein
MTEEDTMQKAWMNAAFSAEEEGRTVLWFGTSYAQSARLRHHFRVIAAALLDDLSRVWGAVTKWRA